MDAKHIVSLNGRDYPLYAGVLSLAHQAGLLGIETELVQAPTDANGFSAIVKATVLMKGDMADPMRFEAYGDASPKNVNPRIATALIRMAETRAKGRALRDAVNIGETLLEELDEESKREPAREPTRPRVKYEPEPASLSPPPAAPDRGPDREAEYQSGKAVFRREDLIEGVYALYAEAEVKGIDLPYPKGDVAALGNEELFIAGKSLKARLSAHDALTEGVQGKAEKKKTAQMVGA